MKEEVKILIEKIMPHYTANSEPEIGPFDFQETGEIASQIISIFEENKMTYTEAYATLSFTHEALKVKAEITHL